MYRYKMLSILIAYLCLLTLSCADSPNNTGTKQKPVVVKKQPLKICLYRYHNFSISKAMYLKEELQRVYPTIELMPEPIQLPKQYYYAPCNRYSGRGLLRDLSQYKQSTVVLGLTNEVIYEPNENHPKTSIASWLMQNAETSSLKLRRSVFSAKPFLTGRAGS